MRLSATEPGMNTENISTEKLQVSKTSYQRLGPGAESPAQKHMKYQKKRNTFLKSEQLDNNRLQ
jgi:hypothetical protein